MRINNLALVLCSSLSLLGAACATDSTRDAQQAGTGAGEDGGDGDTGGDCGGILCGGGDNGGGDTGGGDTGGGDTTCGCNECGCDWDGNVDLNASLDLAVSGTGIYVGVGGCNLVDVSGHFDASLDANATFSHTNDTWTISAVDKSSLDIEIGDGCSCTGVDANLDATVTATAMIHADLNSCDIACDAHAEAAANNCAPGEDASTVYASAHLSCMADCDGALWIKASAAVDANANVSISNGNDYGLVGAELDLHFDALVNADGSTVNL